VRAPDEPATQQRAWEVVRSAYEDHVPSPRRHDHRRVALVLAIAALVGALALSPAGAAVSGLVTRALGVQHAAPALFSLPAPGRLLISGPGGTWAIAADGSTRRLGPWPQASWSPHGRYITVVNGDQLAAVDPGGTPQWTLARPAISDPRWYPPSGYRVAYLSGGELRVVAGDGTADHLLATGLAKVAPAWRPGHPYQLAYVTRRGRVVVRDSDTGHTLWSAGPEGRAATQLMWAPDGQRLIALSRVTIHVYTAAGDPIKTITLPRGMPAIDAALPPSGRVLALVLGGPSNEVVIENLAAHATAPRRVLAGAGLRDLVWSPDGRWLLVSWPAADQWVFIRVAGTPRIDAVSHIARQFSARGHGGFPHIEGWCCTAAGSAS
jgi:WD40 repeat protein